MKLSPFDTPVSEEVGIKRRAIVSVHDVMPETLGAVERILTGPLETFNPARILLLVVPGRAWSESELKRLHALCDQGYELAGHGWSHEIKRIRGFYHLLHSRLLSRRAAEHLALSGDEIAGLLMMNVDWFATHGFVKPQLYVPPAWAVGKVSTGLLRYQPFRWFEVFTGFWDTVRDRRCFAPLVGFEADTNARARFLRWSNRWVWRWSGVRYPVRVAIHPNDFSLLLADQLKDTLSRLEPVHWRTEFEHDGD